jgi:hypothetical protein
MIMSSKHPTTASNSASEAEELKNIPGLGVDLDNYLKNIMYISQQVAK